MVPYSQISLKDQISVIDAFENDLPTAEGLRNLDSVDESSIRYVIRQYLKHWKQRLLSEHLLLHPVSDLVGNCLHSFCRQFMQIRRPRDVRGSDTTYPDTTLLHKLFIL